MPNMKKHNKPMYDQTQKEIDVLLFGVTKINQKSRPKTAIYNHITKNQDPKQPYTTSYRF